MVGDADLVTEMAGDWVTATVTVLEVAVIGDPVGGVPLAVAWSTIEPWSMSAWVTV